MDDRIDDRVDELVREWHRGHGNGRALHAYLGLTPDEYRAFVDRAVFPPGYEPPSPFDGDAIEAGEPCVRLEVVRSFAVLVLALLVIGGFALLVLNLDGDFKPRMPVLPRQHGGPR